MQRFVLAGCAVALLLAASPAAAAAETRVCGAGRSSSPPPAGAGWLCGQIIVGLKPTSSATIEQVVARHGGSRADILARLPDLNAYVVAVAGDEPAAVGRYRSDPDVRYAELNLVGGGVTAPTLPDAALRAAGPVPVPIVLAGVLAAVALAWLVWRQVLSHRAHP